MTVFIDTLLLRVKSPNAWHGKQNPPQFTSSLPLVVGRIMDPQSCPCPRFRTYDDFTLHSKKIFVVWLSWSQDREIILEYPSGSLQGTEGGRMFREEDTTVEAEAWVMQLLSLKRESSPSQEMKMTSKGQESKEWILPQRLQKESSPTNILILAS